jgi:outer membrane protein assembly factor BamB
VRDRLCLFEARGNMVRVRADDGVTESVGTVQPTIVIGNGKGTVAGGHIVGTGEPSEPGVLVALDPEKGAIVWKAASPVGWQPVSADGAVLAGGYGKDFAAEVWAVRGDSGASLWRRGLGVKGRVAQVVAPGDGCAYAVVDEEGPDPMKVVACDVYALDVETGGVRWSYRIPAAKPEPCGVAADADLVVLAAPDGALHVLDALAGSLRARAPVDALLCDFQRFGMVVRAPMAYVLTGNPDVWGGRAPSPQHTLVAIDLDTTRARWKRVGPLSEYTRAVADGERIYVHTDGGEVRAFTLLDGALQWAWYPGVGGTALLVPPEAPRWLIVAGGDDRLGGTVGFDLRAARRRGHARTPIAGRVVPGSIPFELSGIPVHVADEVVRTDALGRFSAEVRGEGYAFAEAMPAHVKPRTPMDDPCATSSVERIALDGRRHADVKITIEFETCDQD